MVANCAVSGSGVLGMRVCRFIWIGVDKDVRSSSSAYHYPARGGSWVWRVYVSVLVWVSVQRWHNDEGLADHLQNASSDWWHTRHSFQRKSAAWSMPASMGPQDSLPSPQSFKQRPWQWWHELPTNVLNCVNGKTNREDVLVLNFSDLFPFTLAQGFFIWLWHQIWSS